MATTGYWQRFERQRISRRRLLGTAGVGAAGLAVLAACGDDNGGTTPGGRTPEPSGTPRPGGTFRDTTPVISDAVFGLHPYLAIAAGPAYFARMYNALFNQSAVDPDFIFNDLAEEYEAVTDLEHIFTIRPNVVIAPNNMNVPERPLDAEDCKASYDAILALEDFLVPPNACQFVCQYFEGLEALENNTVFKITLNRPYAWFPFNIGRAINLVIPKELTTLPAGDLRTNGVGAGPFQITPGTFVEGEGLRMHKHPNYWQTGKPYMDGWDIRIITDRAALRAAFTSQQDYSYGAGSQSEADDLLQQGDYYLGGEDPTYTFIAFSMNVLRPPFDDPRIRLAALYAINRQEYVDIVYEGAAKPNGLVHWPVAGALDPEELETLQPFDPDRSKALIREVTGEDSITINCIFPGNETIEEHDRHLPIWLRQMEQAGFNINREATDTAGWLTRYREKNYDSSLALNQIYETAEIPLDFHESKGPAGSDIYHEGMQDPEIDEAIASTKVLTNFDERVERVKEVQRLIYEKGPAFIPFVTPLSRTLYHNFVKNVPSGIGTSGFFQTQEIWLDL